VVRVVLMIAIDETLLRTIAQPKNIFGIWRKANFSICLLKAGNTTTKPKVSIK